MINVLFAALDERWEDYRAPLTHAFDQAGLAVDLRTDFAPNEVDYIVYAPNSTLTDFTPYTRAKAVINLWAGVEAVVNNPTLKIPLARMVDEGLSRGMVEWVTGHVLRHHLGMDAHITGQTGDWAPAAPPLAKDRPVTILGLGALGQACAEALVHLGFPVTGWSRSAKDVAQITTTHGQAGLEEALSRAQILVLLLPNTPQTQNILNAATLNMMPKGAMIINAGRGPLIDDDALIAALDRGQIGHATLDVFRIEPLPRNHAFWAYSNVTVTPHIASITRPETAAQVIAENITRVQAGVPLLNQVDVTLGY